ncbi:MAG: DUF4349 domain-containing protein [Flavobacteriales bacterium]|nr:DUF4349 domain-containing protein [Flavobacteriales bacterium]
MKTLPFRKIFLWYFVGFTLFFLFRLIYGYNYIPANEAGQNMQMAGMSDFEMSRKNYASQKTSKADIISMEPVSSSDEKYEKVCAASAITANFETDEKKIRDAVESHDAIIQMENKSGLKSNRRLQLGIGVPPEKFDLLVSTIKLIGVIRNIEINKIDKTNEFRELKANVATLEKSRNALEQLKSMGGKVDEFINLENKIMELEERIQGFGVSLGDFDTENEFCTVKFSLSENVMAVKTISLIHRIKVALEWTIKYYGLITLSLLMVIAAAWMGIKIKTLVWPR